MTKDNILAIITKKESHNKVAGGGTPIFFADDEQEMEKISTLLARITLGMVHDLENGVKIIIKH